MRRFKRYGRYAAYKAAESNPNSLSLILNLESQFSIFDMSQFPIFDSFRPLSLIVSENRVHDYDFFRVHTYDFL